MKVRTCPDCGDTKEMAYVRQSSQRCPSCAALQRHAVERIVKLRPMLDRLGAVLAGVRRIATVGIKVAPSWQMAPERNDVALVLGLLDAIEADLEAAADDWSVLLLGQD